jgi:hypothetical protein
MGLCWWWWNRLCVLSGGVCIVEVMALVIYGIWFVFLFSVVIHHIMNTVY